MARAAAAFIGTALHGSGRKTARRRVMTRLALEKFGLPQTLAQPDRYNPKRITGLVALYVQGMRFTEGNNEGPERVPLRARTDRRGCGNKA
jgi:hypothetical protein